MPPQPLQSLLGLRSSAERLCGSLVLAGTGPLHTAAAMATGAAFIMRHRSWNLAWDFRGSVNYRTDGVVVL